MHENEIPTHDNQPIATRSLAGRWRDSLRAKSLDTVHWFIGISAVSAVVSTVTTVVARNPLSPMSAGMNGYDLAMGLATHHSETLERRAEQLSPEAALEIREKASRIREVAALGHIAVAGAGSALAMQPVGADEVPTVASLGTTLAVAVVGGAVALKERHDSRQLGTPDNPNLAQRMGRRLLMTKFVEASTAITGLSAALVANSHYGPPAAAGATFVGVTAYMIAQARDERRARRQLRDQVPISVDEPDID